MTLILNYCWQMCLLRIGPDRLPAHPFTLGLFLGVYLATALLIQWLALPNSTLLRILGMVFAGILIQAALTYSLLLFMSFAHRFIATYSAILGTNAIILIVQLPLILLLQSSDDQALLQSVTFISWLCAGWWLAIAGNIYRRATNISLIQGAAFALAIEALHYMVVATILT